MASSEWGPNTSKGSTAPRPVVQVGGTDPSGNLQSCEIDGSGNLKVAVTGAGSGGTSSVDESTFTAGVSAGTPAMGVYEATPTTLADGKMGIVGLAADRSMNVTIVGGGGSGGTSSSFGAAFPADGTAIGIADPSGNMQALAAETLDFDTGGGTALQTVIGIALPASGGPVAGGTTTNPIRVSASSETTTVYDGSTALTPKFAKIAAASSGDNTLVAAVTSKKIRVLAYNFIANGTVNAKFQSGASGTDLTGLKYCVANMGICANYNPVGWFETASNTLLNLNLSGATAVGGELVYVEV